MSRRWRIIQEAILIHDFLSQASIISSDPLSQQGVVVQICRVNIMVTLRVVTLRVVTLRVVTLRVVKLVVTLEW